nr:aspartyl protease family protein At5g10770-like [Tanacetum cinerariifolium]
EDVVKPLTVEEIFTHDQSRVDSIRARSTFVQGKEDTLGSKATFPAKSGSTIGSASYIVTVGLGLDPVGNTPACSSSTCVYGVLYGDESYSVGFYATDKLTLSSQDVIDNFYFVCGQDNKGLFRGAAGLIGLGRDKLSIM